MDEKTAGVAFNPRTVQQALHALRRREQTAEVEGLVRDLEGFAQTLARLGRDDSANITARRARALTHGGHEVLTRAGKVFALGNREIADALDLQADAIRKLEGAG